MKSGYHLGTEAEALDRVLKGEMAATAKLGKAAGSLLDAPAEGQKVADWLKANAKVLGVPEDATKYTLALPKDMPQGVPIDEALLADARTYAHQNGIPPEVMQGTVDFYGKVIGARISKMATDASNADAKIQGELQSTWGQNYAQNQALAVRAFQTLAAEMKLPPEAAQLTASLLEQGLGSATLTKFMHHIAGKMGEDTLAMPKGGNAPLMQLGAAQGRKEQIMAAHSGDMALALRNGSQARINELQSELTGLNRIIRQFSS